MKPNATRASDAQRVTAIALSVLLVDAASKAAALLLVSRDSRQGVILPIQNPDFTLGLASASLPLMLAVSILGIVVFGGYTAWAAARGVMPVWIPGLVIGGGTGNLADRLLFGAVHDWLDIGHVVVNFADLAVLVGVLGYGVSLLVAHRHRITDPLDVRGGAAT